MSRMLRYFLAVFLIGFGVMLVFANLGMVDFDFNTLWHYIYPVFFVVIGFKWLIDFFRKKGSGWFRGSFFLLLGTLLLLDRFEIITFYFRDVLKLWPLLIIYIGFLLIGGRGKTIIIHRGKKDYTGKYYDKGNLTVGTQEFNQPNWKVEKMNLNTLAGDYYFDFSKAFIPEKEIPIRVSLLAGNVHMLIPENVEFRIDAKVKAGEVNVLGQKTDGVNRSLYFETENYHGAVRKLDFTVKIKAGHIRVDRV
ncbi:hypothetical protein CIL05_12885 [Virgibacillus profundi]|uniref:Cell wall-active antibiotics response LiaF-like C-terminal domain-containing protein n=1 Tax=Virgibacillus profundi TaxID=2024555 RepID=A0A2A2IDR7_9BACI|nr:cell wall-active antibiotics response protein LiaF [Virgibacillus profundi]PAV29285.1 hypothetical protein CIL05_12885 [Virgibacillus profundi]PXY53454.1 hypothetical protein CIT14_13010 [Virgibacillus profundi]